MLTLIEGSYASEFPYEIDAMFRNRAQIFSERLGWNVSVSNGRERDVFDDANPLYLVSVDPLTKKYRGSVRLLPTTGPNMLRDVFPFLLQQGECVESPTIWEISRICAVPSECLPNRNKNGLSPALGELIVGGGTDGRTYPDCRGVRRSDLPCGEGGRLQSAADRKTSADWGYDELCRRLRYWQQSTRGNPSRGRNPRLGAGP